MEKQNYLLELACGTAEDAPVSPKYLPPPATALAPPSAPPLPHTAEQPLTPPADTCLLETPQDGSNTHLPPAAKCAKGNRRPLLLLLAQRKILTH